MKARRSLGFFDVRATLEPDKRTRKFFLTDLPKIVDIAASRFRSNREALSQYAHDEINLAQLYTAIGSPAGGKWVDTEDLDPF